MNISEFNSYFQAISPLLKSYLFRITASKEDAEDIVQDTYIRASQKLDQFRGEASLKTWVFTIASNIAKDNTRAKKRWTENVTDLCRERALRDPDYFPETMQILAQSPQGQFEIREHITFCFTCISKSLPLEQQICLLLKEVYAFKVSEIATIIDQTEAMIKYYLHTGRSKMIDVFDGRCALINKEGTCHQCSELNGILNPKQNTEEELIKIELARTSEKGDKEHLFKLRMQVIQAIDPFQSAGADLQLHHYQFNTKIMEEISEK